MVDLAKYKKKCRKCGALVLASILLSISLVLSWSCADNSADKDGTLYAPFQLGQKTKWMSLEKAESSRKFSGIIEVSQFVDVAQTSEQKKAADDFYAQALANAKARGWFFVGYGLADGYVSEPEVDSLHFPNYEYVYNDEQLNPEAPEFLMYYPTEKGMLLAGVMFYQNDVEAQGIQIGGPETIWHYHYFLPVGKCMEFTSPLKGKLATQIDKGKCDKGYWFGRTPQMLHLWFVDHPLGRFASNMGVDTNLLLSNEMIVSEHAKAKTRAEAQIKAEREAERSVAP